MLQSRKYLTLHLKTLFNANNLHVPTFQWILNLHFRKLDISTSTLSPLNPQHTSDRMCNEYTNLPSIQLDILYHQYPNDRNKIDLEQGQNFRSSVSTIISLRRRKGIRIYLKLNWEPFKIHPFPPQPSGFLEPRKCGGTCPQRERIEETTHLILYFCIT